MNNVCGQINRAHSKHQLITERESGCVLCFNVHFWEMKVEEAMSVHSLEVTGSSCSWLGRGLCHEITLENRISNGSKCWSYGLTYLMVVLLSVFKGRAFKHAPKCSSSNETE